MSDRRRRPTLKDIADDTGLSSAAVSYALRGLQSTPETQARVREAASRLGYEADPIARALASGKTGNVGVLCGSLDDSWQQGLAAALGRGLLGAGRNAFTVDGGNDPELEASLAKRLADQRVDALVVLPVDPLGAHWAELARKVPIVAVGDGLPGADTAAEVVWDNVAGVSDALRRLAEAGHRRVTVLTSVDRETPDRPAERVVRELSPRLGLTAAMVTAPHDLDGAAVVATRILEAEDHPTALLCLADSIAFGVYAAARELGISVPEDVSVLGFDDLPVSRLLSPPLSSYSWPVGALVDAVVTQVVNAIEDRPTTARTVLPPTPEPRGSLAAPRVSARSAGSPGS